MALVDGLSEEDCQLQSMPDASPAKWHLAHATWFFETFVLEAHERPYRPFDASYRMLFNSYYDAVGERPLRSERGLLSRPSLATVLAWRVDVDIRLARLLAERSDDPAVQALVELGLQHEQQHQELLLTDLKHAMSRHPLRPAVHLPASAAPRDGPIADVEALAGVAPGWVAFDGGEFELGHADADAGFAFDHERPRHAVRLEPFRLADRPVLQGEVLDFIADGGYDRPRLWLSQGWDVAQAERWRAPLYWRQCDDTWTTYTLLHGEAPVARDEPATHLSLFEADAIARWLDARLPTEAEWERAAASVRVEGNFLESGRWHPRPPPAGGAGHLRQIFGDVWEWTASAYLPYPGFRASPGALGEYNGKFMCNQMVLRGGSCATPGSHVRATYRNFFPPHARWQFSGLRLARDAAAG